MKFAKKTLIVSLLITSFSVYAAQGPRDDNENLNGPHRGVAISLCQLCCFALFLCHNQIERATSPVELSTQIASSNQLLLTRQPALPLARGLRKRPKKETKQLKLASR